MGGGETSSAKLISQIRSFYLRDIEFDYPFSNNEDSSVREALSNAKASDDLNEDNDDDFFDSDDDNDENNDNNDSELNKLLNVNVSVVIEPHPITINHGSNTFDIEATLDIQMINVLRKSFVVAIDERDAPTKSKHERQ
uniref:Uncharacterized protein n=1 Tax=Rhizophagus irregularis (strain DAOM 181602 / DAOM 197198 / MUCL 43194) TaxID=747089 RepID=U9U2E7_RHIID